MYDADRSQSVNQNLTQNNIQNREALVSQVQQAITNNAPMQPVVGNTPQTNFVSSAPVEQAPSLPEMPSYYSDEQPAPMPMHQITQSDPTDIFKDPNAPEEPVAEEPAQPNPSMVELANSTDLSVQTIAKEANRISEKQEQASQNPDNGEVYISLH
jgi:hypothetical protein